MSIINEWKQYYFHSWIIDVRSLCLCQNENCETQVIIIYITTQHKCQVQAITYIAIWGLFTESK